MEATREQELFITYNADRNATNFTAVAQENPGLAMVLIDAAIGKRSVGMRFVDWRTGEDEDIWILTADLEAPFRYRLHRLVFLSQPRFPSDSTGLQQIREGLSQEEGWVALREC